VATKIYADPAASKFETLFNTLAESTSNEQADPQIRYIDKCLMVHSSLIARPEWTALPQEERETLLDGFVRQCNT